jgi:hypothetical protein
MKPATAIKLIEKAVDFYVQQNLEVAANMFGFGLTKDDYARERFEKRENMRQAVAWTKECLRANSGGNHDQTG